jgi:hypothetical protein
MIDDPSQSEEKALRVEGRGCVFGRQVVFGYPPRNRDAGAIQGVHEIGGTPYTTDYANNIRYGIQNLTVTVDRIENVNGIMTGTFSGILNNSNLGSLNITNGSFRVKRVE